MKSTKWPGVFQDRGMLYTLDLTGTGKPHYGEPTVDDGGWYRQWDPYRSKLAAMLKQGLRNFPFSPEGHVLYLGAASGTTVSHVSDIVTRGKITAVEMAPRPFRDLITLARDRDNITPVMADAREPEHYLPFSRPGGYSVVYQDIAQKDQIDIFLENLDAYLSSHGKGIICVKTRSIDSTQKSKSVFKQVRKTLSIKGLRILETIYIGRYQKGHYSVIVEKPGG